MSQEVIIWGVIGIYVLFMLVIGITNTKSAKKLSDFTLGGRNAGAWVSALSYGTAYFSAVMFIGYSGGSGWNYGLWSIFAGIGNAVIGSLLAWLVLARRTREVTNRLKITTMPQLFETRYESTKMKTFSAAVIFIFLLPYSASVYKGLSSVCSVLLGFDERICMIVIAIASAVVLVLGGYLATLKADFVQGLVMMVGVTALIISVVKSPTVGGLANGWENMTKYMSENMPMDGMSHLSLWATVLMTSFGTWGLPQMIHKYYGIKDDKEVKRGTIISTFFALLVAGGGYFIGSLSHLFFDNNMPAGGKDFIIPNMLKMSNLPTILLGIVLVLLISASVSTLSSITLTACSTLTQDLIKARWKKNMSDGSTATMTRILCLVFVVLSYFVANYPTPILEMMSYSWGIISGSFLAPYMLSLYSKKINRAGAWAGMIGGFLTAFVPVAVSGFKTPNGPIYACAAMAVSFILCIGVSYLARALKWKSAAENDKFYTKVVEEKV